MTRRVRRGPIGSSYNANFSRPYRARAPQVILLDMQSRAPAAPRIPPVFLALALLFLAALAMGAVLHNSWVQDDNGIIEHNPLVHVISGTWRAFRLPYWPGGERAELYRPLAIAFLTVQWVIGQGAPWVFRLTNLLCYGASILAVWTLLRRLTPAPAAWVGAAVFAVHPVHVEAVAESVNQGETLVAALLCWAAIRYIDWRRGTIPPPRARAEILLAFSLGLFIKEHTLILPGLLLALELSVLNDGASWRERLRIVGPLYATLFLLGGLFWFARGTVLGPGSGTSPAEALQRLSMSGRALTMLGVVPEWIRLLVWPAHLQAEWSPLEYVAYGGWSVREWVGVIGLGTLLLALGLSWGRWPRIQLAMLWLAVALFPVSSLLVPIGVVLAERTMFLPSVAVALILADLATRAEQSPRFARGPLRTGLVALLGLCLGLGIIASSVRMVTWRNRALFLTSAVRDAPLSYRTHLSWGVILDEVGDTLEADAALRHAVALQTNNMAPFVKLAWNLQHRDGVCRPALTLYTEILRRMPGRSDMRAGYIACAAWLARYEDATRVAQEGVALGIDAAYWQSALQVLARATRDHAAAGTVHLPPLPGGWMEIGPSKELAAP